MCARWVAVQVIGLELWRSRGRFTGLFVRADALSEVDDTGINGLLAGVVHHIRGVGSPASGLVVATHATI